MFFSAIQDDQSLRLISFLHYDEAVGQPDGSILVWSPLFFKNVSLTLEKERSMPTTSVAEMTDCHDSNGNHDNLLSRQSINNDAADGKSFSFMSLFLVAGRAFWQGLKGSPYSHSKYISAEKDSQVLPQEKDKQCISEERELRENLSEKQIDHMVEDSFPASDPPSTY